MKKPHCTEYFLKLGSVGREEWKEKKEKRKEKEKIKRQKER